MKKRGMLNSHIAKVIDDMGHTDQITVGDCGLPVPQNVPKIDLSLRIGVPSFIDVVKEILTHLEVEKIILAEEIKIQNPEVFNQLKIYLPDKVEIEFMPHEDFKMTTQDSKAIIRTGEVTPFSNVILQSGVIF